MDLQYQIALYFAFNKRRIAIQNETKSLQPHDVLPTEQVFSLLFKVHVESVELHSVLDWD